MQLVLSISCTPFDHISKIEVIENKFGIFQFLCIWIANKEQTLDFFMQTRAADFFSCETASCLAL